MGETGLNRQAVRALLAARGIPESEIEAVTTAFAAPDPAGVMPPAAREEVAYVAAYLTPIASGIPRHSPIWRNIARGHPAARALFAHEQAELAACESLRVRNPLDLRRDSITYWRAHALACCREAEYWAAWAAAEGKAVAWHAFLRAHPLRGADERAQTLHYLRSAWQIAVPDSPVVEWEQARRFYAEKRMTPEGMREG